MAKAGLSVVVRLKLKACEKGVKAQKTQADEKAIAYHKDIPDLNYGIYP